MLAADSILADRVRIMLGAVYRDTLGLMRRRRAALDALAKTLVKKSALNGADAERLMARHGDAS